MRLLVKGPATLYSGFGKVFLGLADRLRTKFPTEILATDNRVPDGYPLPITQVPNNRLFGVLFGYPPELSQLPTEYRVLYTMYEASDIPEDWKLRLREPDEVWVPTTFCGEVFGQYRPVRIVPVGFEDRIFFRKSWSRAERETFWWPLVPEAIGKRVVGTAGVMSKRKGVDLLIRAWELAGLEDAVLVIKTRDTRGPIGESGTAFVIDQDWPDEQMADFYRSLDLFVLPSRGEGLGLPPLEAAACGTPALVTRASGPADYIDDRGIYGIEVRGQVQAPYIEETREGIRAQEARWYEPDLGDLLDKLRRFCQDAPAVEHQYRNWSMTELAGRWETELRAARERAICSTRR